MKGDLENSFSSNLRIESQKKVIICELNRKK